MAGEIDHGVRGGEGEKSRHHRFAIDLRIAFFHVMAELAAGLLSEREPAVTQRAAL